MAYTTIKKPSDYFTPNLHSGTGSSQNITTGLNMSANGGLVWNKVRSTSNNHILCDTIRGATKLLHSDLTLSEQTDATSLTSFNTDGWSGGGSGNTNGSGQTFVSWNWLAGSSPSGVANTDGSISSTVSANTTSGFSIVSYTGTNATGTVGHGLGSTPKVVIYKNRTDVTNWYFTTTVIDGSNDLLFLNTTEASQTFSAPVATNSLLNLIANNDTNGSGDNIIAYCFAEKQGFSKFGSYTGNGNADGTFVYTGFKPAFVIQKNTSVTQGWQLQDNKRLGYNPNNYLLQPHDSAAESALQRIDLLSNGFKVRTTDAGQNASGNNYIYMAFAEEPLVGDNPATAR